MKGLKLNEKVLINAIHNHEHKKCEFIVAKINKNKSIVS